jgi:hydrogenase nickel incorporation protein HypA/HybF
MHEWALAEGVISAALKVSVEEGIKEITEVIVDIGELQQVEHDVLVFALNTLKTPEMKDARFVLRSIPAKMRCRACGEEWSFSPEGLGEEVSEAIHFVPEVAHVYIKCPRCGSPDFEVVEGRGVWLAQVKGVRTDG